MRSSSNQKILLFGASGAIGCAIKTYFKQEDWTVVSVIREKSNSPGEILWQALVAEESSELEALRNYGPFDAVCWAQGTNLNDSVYRFDRLMFEEMFSSNVTFILETLNVLLTHNLLTKPAKLCVISSIWQERARQNKLSYSTTKSALRGLILSAANDLGRDGHLINAVLPGVIDTPMTRENLSAEQVQSVINGTQFERLASLQDVAAAVYCLCCRHNKAITGQFIAVDLGYSNVRIL